MQRLRVLSAEDHAMIRMGLRYVLNAERDIKIVGEAATLAEESQQLRSVSVDVFMLDISLNAENGFDLLSVIRLEPLDRSWCNSSLSTRPICRRLTIFKHCR